MWQTEADKWERIENERKKKHKIYSSLRIKITNQIVENKQSRIRGTNQAAETFQPPPPVQSKIEDLK